MRRPEFISPTSFFLWKKDKDEYYTLKVSGLQELNSVIDALRNRSILIKEIIPQKNTLEEMFISLIQEANKEEKK